MARKFKKKNIGGVKIAMPIEKWATPMKERSPRSSVFKSAKYHSKAGRSQVRAALKGGAFI